MSDKEYQLNESRNKSETGTDKKNVLICNVLNKILTYYFHFIDCSNERHNAKGVA